MTSSSYSQWRQNVSATPDLDITDGLSQVLPRFRVHSRVLKGLRARVAAEDDCALLGTLAARDVQPNGQQLPYTFYADTLLPVQASTLKLGAHSGTRVHIPIVKCQAAPVQKTMRAGALRWRRLNEKTHSDRESLQLLRGAVALVSQSGSLLTLVVAFEAPQFTLWTAQAFDTPLIAENPLALALAAATPLRPFETVGFLVHPQGDTSVIAPVRNEDSKSPTAGVWVLGDGQAARGVSATYTLRAATRRNTRLRRADRADNAGGDGSSSREISFTLAQYSDARGGAPSILRCTARVGPRTETYVAAVSEGEEDEDIDTIAVDFQTVSSIVQDEKQMIEDEGNTEMAQGNLNHLVNQVSALRAAMESREQQTTPVVEEEQLQQETAHEENVPLPLRSITGDDLERRNNRIDLDNLPRSIRVDFDAEQVADSRAREAGDADNWQRIEALVKKYLGENEFAAARGNVQ